MEHLFRQGFEALCPMVRRSKRVGKKRIEVLEPLFASYLFIRLDTRGDRWRSINGTMGVRRLVCFGTEPASLPEGLVETFVDHSGPGGELHFEEELLPGDQVRIIGGAFDDLCGLLLGASSLQRVSVLLDLLGATRPVTISRDRLQAA